MPRLYHVVGCCCVALVSTTSALRVHAAAGCALTPRARPRHRPAVAGLLDGPLKAWEDVLDYLTNMGGYTGFTEGELKGGKIDEARVESFGRPQGDASETTTTVFVSLLIALPISALFLAIALFGPPSLFP